MFQILLIGTLILDKIEINTTEKTLEEEIDASPVFFQKVKNEYKLQNFSPQFSTLFGGSGEDTISSLTLDSSDNIVLAGQTSSGDFPTFNAYNSTYGGSEDIFLAKFSSTGQLLFSTYLGGSSLDSISSLRIDSSGNIVLAGATSSPDFPILNAYKNTYGGDIDVFLAKFSSTGQLLFSTYLGGSSLDLNPSLRFDSSGNIVLAGVTSSSDFPTLNAYNSIYSGSEDGFLVKFSSTGQLLFSTYLGGSSLDSIFSLGIDSSGNIVLAGVTSSPDFPTLNAYNSIHRGDLDEFLAKFSSTGQLLFSTYLGGSNLDFNPSLRIDSSDNIVLVGRTYSVDFPILNAYESTYGGGDGDDFLVKFSSTGQLLFSTYLGGSRGDFISSLEIDSSGNIVLAGITNSPDFPTLNTFDSTYRGVFDVFLTKFSSTGQLLFSTYLGGSSGDFISSLVLVYSDNIVLAGQTRSVDFPTLNAYNGTYGGGNGDGFLTIFSSTGQLFFSTYLGGSNVDSISSLVLDSSNNIILGGGTYSDDFSTLNGYNNLSGGPDVFLTKFFLDDYDFDHMADDWEQIYGLDLTKNDAQEDLDGDGLPNLWEFQNGLIPNSNDALEDKDKDGLTNIQEFRLGSSPNNKDTDNDGIPDEYEYFMGLNLTFNDAFDDKDQDGMPNLWEYHNGLNATLNDAYNDKDGDWVTNVVEYLSGTDPNNFWSFPLLYQEFPYIINAPIGLSVLFSILGIIIGWAAAYKLKKYHQRRLIIQLGAPDYTTALKMQQGKFSDYDTYQKALVQNITNGEDYQLMNEPNNISE
ncbi:MAG: putative WD repeat-containing protein L264 [Candidatus Heimdallarchaeota archaeon LC_3]|nr:MAG: putative WD repeat-containing protein L264 [Candidatus Heimdallarchaeota archaeon LC_3]